MQRYIEQLIEDLEEVSKNRIFQMRNHRELLTRTKILNYLFEGDNNSSIILSLKSFIH